MIVASSHHRLPGRQFMTIRELDSVVLQHDLPEHGLRKGDLGAIVAVDSPDAFDVEFFRVNGDTQALVSLSRSDIRPIADNDLPAVRTASRRGVA